ncbi:hypothetical protein HN911_00185 [Candidatus Bathyarchaeota archaeon]|jgi:hypothetical protein|nr:hypothetical protein [Candidatus Bathyarchaeota archaeon]
MHYTEQYKGSKEEMDAQAIEGVRRYLGQDLFRKVTLEMKEAVANIQNLSQGKELIRGIRMSFWMAGIEGRPVSAMIRKAWRG